jgi:hypothetical protein
MYLWLESYGSDVHCGPNHREPVTELAITPPSNHGISSGSFQYEPASKLQEILTVSQDTRCRVLLKNFLVVMLQKDAHKPLRLCRKKGELPDPTIASSSTSTLSRRPTLILMLSMGQWAVFATNVDVAVLSILYFRSQFWHGQRRSLPVSPAPVRYCFP